MPAFIAILSSLKKLFDYEMRGTPFLFFFLFLKKLRNSKNAIVCAKINSILTNMRDNLKYVCILLESIYRQMIGNSKETLYFATNWC